MRDYVISGIQQVGIGVKDLKEAWSWYNRYFGMDCRVFEDEAEAKLMLPYTGGQPRSRHAVLALNLQSGGGFEIWQYKGREPVEFKGEIEIGDLGITCCKMKAKNVEKSREYFIASGIDVIDAKGTDPAGRKTFFVKDPWSNLFQVVEANDWFMNENKVTGGSYGVTIGVSDIDMALPVYSGILGYDKVIYDKTCIFGDLEGLAGGKREFRRILLRRNQPFAGPFSRMLGDSEIELVALTSDSGRKIYEGRFWGDPGFIHLCYDIRGMDELQQYSESCGFPFTVDSKKSHEGSSFDMGEAAGHFSYIEDRDGTLIEFVETHKLPLLKKFGWYLDLRKRDPLKPLPGWMLKTLIFSRVKH